MRELDAERRTSAGGRAVEREVPPGADLDLPGGEAVFGGETGASREGSSDGSDGGFRLPRMAEPLETALFLAISGLARLLPESAALRLGGAAGGAAGVLLRSRRRVVIDNLGIAFPERPEEWRRATARASWRHLGRELAAAIRMSRRREALLERTRLPDLEQLEEALALGRGVVLFGAHLGNLELGAAALTSRGLPFRAVAKPLRNARLDRELAAARGRMGWRAIDAGRAAVAAARALREGGIVAIPSDQNPAKGGELIPFFGRAAPTPLGAATLALRLRTPAFFAYVLSSASARPVWTLHLEELESGSDPVSLAAAYNRALERAVRAAPEQYFWQHRRWKERPSTGNRLPRPPYKRA